MVFVILEMIGIIGNLLCVKNALPLKGYAASILWTFGFILIIMFIDRRGKKLKYIGELTKGERAMTRATFIPGCIVYYHDSLYGLLER